MITSIKKLKKYKIPIAYSLDNNYVYPTLVSLTSLIETKNYKTFYDIYLMISNNFTLKNKKKLKSIEQKYRRKCSIKFINMTNLFTNLKKGPISQYYRLALHEKLPDMDKIIYLDGDTLIFEDLKEMYDLNMKGKYILGFIDNIYYALESFGIRNAIVINSGVLLMDLNALRKYNTTDKFNDFIKLLNNSIDQGDQTLINVVLQKHISTLPPKYGMWGFENEYFAKEHNKIQKPWLRYRYKEFIEAFNHPAILHYTGAKPFRDKKAVYYSLWWEYAKKTGFFNEIYNYSNFSNYSTY